MLYMLSQTVYNEYYSHVNIIAIVITIAVNSTILISISMAVIIIMSIATIDGSFCHYSVIIVCILLQHNIWTTTHNET